MGLQKITFDGANVTSKMDADLYHFLFSNTVGILNGLKNSVAYSLANNKITFQDGYVSIYGRIVYVENGNSVSITPDSNKYGYVVLGVNTHDNSINLYIKEQAGNYPSLVQTHLPTIDGLYEFALCAYTKTTTSISLDSYFQRSLINTNQIQVDNVRGDIASSLESKRLSVTIVQSGVYKAYISSSELNKGLLIAVIGRTTTISIPGALFFINTGSTKPISYYYGGSVYSLRFTYKDDKLTITCGSTKHELTQLFLYK